MLSSMGGKAGVDDVNDLFNPDALQALTRALGGVPRDFLTVFVHAAELAAAEARARWITPKHVYKGAGRLSYQTKLSHLRDDADGDAGGLERVLVDLMRFCLKNKRKTGFLISQDEAQRYTREHELIRQLMDFKLITAWNLTPLRRRVALGDTRRTLLTSHYSWSRGGETSKLSSSGREGTTAIALEYVSFRSTPWSKRPRIPRLRCECRSRGVPGKKNVRPLPRRHARRIRGMSIPFRDRFFAMTEAAWEGTIGDVPQFSSLDRLARQLATCVT